MSTTSWIHSLCLACVTTTLVCVSGVGAALGQCVPQTPQAPGAPSNEVVQTFPASGNSQTAWRVQWGHAVGEGLYITGAWFKRTPAEPWVKILADARLADIFAPYNSGYPRYYDLTGFNFRLVPVTPTDLGPCGTALDPVVVKEVLDRGVLWKDDTEGYRGKELVLWATLDASNYNYMIRYAFQDDGTIAFRVGATARNLPGSEHESHMHEGLWRVDVDLAGSTHDSAIVMRHQQSQDRYSAYTVEEPFNGGVEGYVDWVDTEFTELRIQDEVATNATGKNISYDLKPMRMGTVRHPEEFSQHDFWVTRAHENELFYTELPTYISNREPVTNTDLVAWYLSSVYHRPRDEDGQEVGPFWKGVALTMWSGFDLRPRNFFNVTPQYP